MNSEQLAAHYGYNVDRLRFEWNRRSFGSGYLDCDASERNRYCRAWRIAVNHNAVNATK